MTTLQVVPDDDPQDTPRPRTRQVNYYPWDTSVPGKTRFDVPAAQYKPGAVYASFRHWQLKDMPNRAHLRCTIQKLPNGDMRVRLYVEDIV